MRNKTYCFPRYYYGKATTYYTKYRRKIKRTFLINVSNHFLSCFCKPEFPRTATKEVIETAAAIISGARLREMSALYFLHYISMAGSLREVIESEDGAGQEWKVRVRCFL